MKKIIMVMAFGVIVSYINSETIVKLALPDNCNLTNQVSNVSKDNASRLEIRPNPSTGIFSLSVTFGSTIGKATITVFDLSGKSVYNQTVYSDSNSLVKSMDISTLSQGTYIIVVKNEQESLSTKLVINK